MLYLHFPFCRFSLKTDLERSTICQSKENPLIDVVCRTVDTCAMTYDLKITLSAPITQSKLVCYHV